MPLFKGTASKATPKKAIEYITKPDKAVIVSSLSMDDSRNYAKQFKETCELYSKGNRHNERKYYHFKLSCNPTDNPTPQQSHELAEKLAQELFSAHECVIATHTDSDVIHSHILINAVSFETGKKFHMNNKEYEDCKDLADVLGIEMGFTPLYWREKVSERYERMDADVATESKTLSNAEINIVKRDTEGTASWKDALRQAIDEAKLHCINRVAFEKYLHDTFGVIMTRNTKKTVSFVHPAIGEKYAIRGAKLGNDYTATSIDEALLKNRERSSINARLFTHTEQQHTTKSNINISIIPSQPTSQNGNGERYTAGVLGEVDTELRRIDEAVSRITTGVQSGDEPENGGASKHIISDRENVISQPKRDEGTDRTKRQEPSKPATKSPKHDPVIQQKPKRRSYENER